MLTRRDKQEVRKKREKILEELSKRVPTPSEAERLGWKMLYDHTGQEIIGYLKPNGDIIFIDGTRVSGKSVEVDDPNDVDEG